VKTLITIVTTLVVVAGLYWLVAAKFAPKPEAAPPTPVKVELVKTGALAEIVSAPGVIQPRTKVQISAKIVAQIVKMPFKEGDLVKKDDSIVELDSKDLKAAVDAAKARYEAQTANLQAARERIDAHVAQIAASRVVLADAERDYKRQLELRPDVSQAVVDAAQTKYDQQKESLKSEEANLASERSGVVAMTHELTASLADLTHAQDNMGYAIIRSPIDGIVTRMNAKFGEMVVTGTMNNAGTVIMEISDLSQMLVEAQVDENNIAAVHPGQKARVHISAYPDETFDGVVRLVALDTAQQDQGGGGNRNNGSNGKWYKAEILLNTKDKSIQVSLSADVDIDTQIHENVVKVPTQAVLGRNVDDLPEAVKKKPEVDKNHTLATVVYVLKDGKAEVTPVTIGASDMTHTIIKSGLSAGEQIITGPFKVLASLANDQKVKDDQATTKPSTQATTQTTQPTTQN